MDFDDFRLPDLKYIPDEQDEVTMYVESRRKESTEKHPIQLFTDSMVMLSSSDTLNENQNKSHAAVYSSSECGDSPVFAQNRAFSYYDSPSQSDNDEAENLSFSSSENTNTIAVDLDEDSEYCVEIVSRFLCEIQKDLVSSNRCPNRLTPVASQRGNHQKLQSTRKIKSCPDAARISTSSSGDRNSMHPLSRSTPQTKTERYHGQNTESTRYKVNSESMFYTAETVTVTTDSAADSVQTAVETMRFQDSDIDFGDGTCTAVYCTDTHVFMTANDTLGQSSSTVTNFTPNAAVQLNTTIDSTIKCRSCSLDGLKFNPACPLQRRLVDNSNELIVI